jgi:tetratricopeptide (TPR) repeat protein
MDERQAQIRERAGLEESLLNVEFIQWLQKWGSWILMAAALAAAIVWARQKWEVTTKARMDRAFFEYEQARGRGGNPSPDALTAVATEYEGVGAVADLARLAAADAYLDAVRRGIKVGASVKSDPTGRTSGELENPEDALSEQDRADYLNRAADLYEAVRLRCANNPDRVILTLNALYGLAAVDESRGDLDAARSRYQQIVSVAETAGFDLHARIATSRIERLDSLREVPSLPARAQVPKPPEPAAPVVLPAPGSEQGVAAPNEKSAQPVPTTRPMDPQPETKQESPEPPR